MLITPDALLAPDGTCLACSRRCNLGAGAGLCGVRRLDDRGRLVVDGSVTHAAIQRVEDKPLYHFRPGTRLLTVGSWGCGTRCAYCRNAAVALARRPPAGPGRNAAAIVPRALAAGIAGIAFSYNEPLVRAEQVAATCAGAVAAGLEAVIVTSGFATDEVIELLLPVTTAWRVDIKAAGDDSARAILGAGTPWASPFRCLRRLSAAGMHAEVSLTYSPSIHGSDELARFGRAVARAGGAGTPVHVQPLLPAHRLHWIRPASVSELKTAHATLRASGLEHVYVHLLGPAALRTTLCGCGEALVERSVGGVRVLLDAERRCPGCGANAPIAFGNAAA